jgi:predicted phosphodiesterase
MKSKFEKFIISTILFFLTAAAANLQNNNLKANESKPVLSPLSNSQLSDSPKLRMPVFSDVHIRDNGENGYFVKALSECNKFAPNYDAIAIVGDITDSGKEKQYDRFMETLNSGINKNAKKIIAVGNHEFFERDTNKALTNDLLSSRFAKRTGMPGIYYDDWIKGYHMIVLGGPNGIDSSGIRTDFPIISEEQYQWLEKTIAIEADWKKPIFIFLHQPINDTVYGSRFWNGDLKDERLKNILKKYPQSILFSGHSHCTLDHPRTVFQDGFTMVNTSSLAYTWFEGGSGRKNLSQGFIMEVYDDRVDLKAMEFSTSQVIKSYKIPIPFINALKDTEKPFFHREASAYAQEIKANSAIISWDKAIDNLMTDKYIIKCNNSTVKIEYINYWEEANRFSTEIVDLKPETSYTFEIFAQDAFENISDNSLKVSFKTGQISR